MSNRTYEVKLLGLGDDGSQSRSVDVPMDKVALLHHVSDLLEEIFYFGQNDFQPKPIRSVSVGDVAFLPNGEKWLVLGAGWKKLTPEEYLAYVSMTPEARTTQAYTRSIGA